jgi:hypothetical protein
MRNGGWCEGQSSRLDAQALKRSIPKRIPKGFVQVRHVAEILNGLFYLAQSQRNRSLGAAFVCVEVEDSVSYIMAIITWPAILSDYQTFN